MGGNALNIKAYNNMIGWARLAKDEFCISDEELRTLQRNFRQIRKHGETELSFNAAAADDQVIFKKIKCFIEYPMHIFIEKT